MDFGLSFYGDVFVRSRDIDCKTSRILAQLLRYEFEMADSEPLEARQFRQWHSVTASGSELRGSETVIRPQLQAP